MAAYPTWTKAMHNSPLRYFPDGARSIKLFPFSRMPWRRRAGNSAKGRCDAMLYHITSVVMQITGGRGEGL